MSLTNEEKPKIKLRILGMESIKSNFFNVQKCQHPDDSFIYHQSFSFKDVEYHINDFIYFMVEHDDDDDANKSKAIGQILYIYSDNSNAIQDSKFKFKLVIQRLIIEQFIYRDTKWIMDNINIESIIEKADDCVLSPSKAIEYLSVNNHNNGDDHDQIAVYKKQNPSIMSLTKEEKAKLKLRILGMQNIKSNFGYANVQKYQHPDNSLIYHQSFLFKHDEYHINDFIYFVIADNDARMKDKAIGQILYIYSDSNIIEDSKFKLVIERYWNVTKNNK